MHFQLMFIHEPSQKKRIVRRISNRNYLLSIPAMSQAWYDAIYQDLDGNATLLAQVLSWLDGNHSAIETLFVQLDGNATLLLQTVNSLDGKYL